MGIICSSRKSNVDETYTDIALSNSFNNNNNEESSSITSTSMSSIDSLKYNNNEQISNKLCVENDDKLKTEPMKCKKINSSVCKAIIPPFITITKESNPPENFKYNLTINPNFLVPPMEE
ncbi:hypothetical protein ABK040_011615 [Willaertia magna]